MMTKVHVKKPLVHIIHRLNDPEPIIGIMYIPCLNNDIGSKKLR